MFRSCPFGDVHVHFRLNLFGNFVLQIYTAANFRGPPFYLKINSAESTALSCN